MQKRRIGKQLCLAMIALVFLAGGALMAQDNPSDEHPVGEDKGPTASETVYLNSDEISGMVKFDTNLGWNFTRHFGFDVGVPYMLNTRPGLFASTNGSLGYVNYPYVSCDFYFGCYYGVGTSSRMWTGELGDVYAEAHYTRTYHRYNFATNLTGDAPTASYRKGLTSGRVQWDWINHVDTNFHGFDPFANFGLANGRMDQHFLARPYDTNLPFRTLGYLADFEAGVQYKLWRRLTLGGSMWDVLPMGPQRIYSNIVWAQPGEAILDVGGSQGLIGGASPPTVATGTPGTFGYLAGDPNHGRYWNSSFETVGPSYITRDNGYSGTIGVSPAPWFDVLVGYNHSVRYAMDEVTLTFQFNANSLFRKVTNY